jgi:ferritin
MASHFAKNNVALSGFAGYFMEQSDEERMHAKLMIDYLLKRGGASTPLNAAVLSLCQFSLMPLCFWF